MSEQLPTPEAFRTALASCATGVTVVTAVGGTGPSGATANAVTSLSLKPPLMLACLDRNSRTLASVLSTRRFGVNVLASGQEWVARQFSGKHPEPEKWADVKWAESQGSPRIHGSLAWIACELDREIDGGDHVILVGRVLAADGSEREPLLFWRGGYRGA